MKITKIHLAQTIIKVTISMAALVGFAVTSTQQASADSSSPFYNGEQPNYTPVEFQGSQLQFSVYFTNEDESATSNYGSYASHYDGTTMKYLDPESHSIIDKDKLKGQLYAKYVIYNPTNTDQPVNNQFSLRKIGLPSNVLLASFNWTEKATNYTPASGFTDGPQIYHSGEFYTLTDFKAKDQQCFTVDSVAILKTQGTLGPKGTYILKVPLKVADNINYSDNSDGNTLYLANALRTPIANNKEVIDTAVARARFAEQVPLTGKFLPVVKNADGSYTPISDIQSVMPNIANNNGSLRFDDFWMIGFDSTVNTNFDTLQQVPYTTSKLSYYIDESKLLDSTGASLLDNLKKNYGYTLPTNADGTTQSLFNYVYGDTPTFTKDGKTIANPLGSNGVGNFYLVFSKIPNWVKPTDNNNHGGGSSGSSTTTTTTNNSTTTNPTNNAWNPSNPTATNGTGLPNYAAVKGAAVYATKKIYMYKHADFKKSQRIAVYPKVKRVNRPMFVVLDYVKSSNGTLRYKVRDVNHGKKTAGKVGYITSSKKYVVNAYYQTMPKSKKITVIAKNGVHAYKSASLNGRSKTYKKGTKLTVKKIVKHNLTTRYQLSNGYYVTANKKFVIQH
ncbi:DUF5776 domain-containing protein [Lentilactobacillus parabuchneri]|uniref:DUF5776 domain-containing protein n=1 Tax=Lentilactobacillus parabuchneri TaxID=152331 RepID=UPI001CECAA6B|nr:DUF5776 domain-containing protein [Lentilactobacillus parabuchneri]